MDELDPLTIGSHEDAQQYAHRILIGIHRRLMEHYLDSAQKELDDFARSTLPEKMPHE